MNDFIFPQQRFNRRAPFLDKMVSFVPADIQLEIAPVLNSKKKKKTFILLLPTRIFSRVFFFFCVRTSSNVAAINDGNTNTSARNVKCDSIRWMVHEFLHVSLNLLYNTELKLYYSCVMIYIYISCYKWYYDRTTFHIKCCPFFIVFWNFADSLYLYCTTSVTRMG